MTGAAVPTGAAHVHALIAALGLAGPTLETTTTRWGRQLATALPRGRRVLAVGNGGSAAQAQHLTAELVGRYRDDRMPYSALALHAETSSLTAIVNDYGAEDMFARQVAAHGRRRDVLMLMSTSGRSPNLLRAAETGRRRGLAVWSMTGRLPNPLADISQDVLAVDADSTATVQEVHLVALHLICAALDVALGVCHEVVADLTTAEVPA
jgi:phosphoheptose isomerase